MITVFFFVKDGWPKACDFELFKDLNPCPWGGNWDANLSGTCWEKCWMSSFRTYPYMYCTGLLYWKFQLMPKSLLEGRCLRNPGAPTAITNPRHENTRLACPTRNQATSCPRQAPLRHPSHLSQMAQWKKIIFWGGIGREHWEPLNYQNY